MPVKMTPWDPLDYMNSEESRLYYLLACVEDGPFDAADFARCFDLVQRSRARYAGRPDSGLTGEALRNAVTGFPDVPQEQFAMVFDVLGHTAPARDLPAASKRAAAKRSRRGSIRTGKPTP